MTRPTVTYPRPETRVIDVLNPLLTEPVVGKLPADWTVTSDPVLVVTLDGTPTTNNTPVAYSPTVRLTAWSNSPTDSHNLVMAAVGRLEAHDGSEFTARLLNGPLEATDPDHGNAELRAVTMRVRVRSTPLT